MIIFIDRHQNSKNYKVQYSAVTVFSCIILVWMIAKLQFQSNKENKNKKNKKQHKKNQKTVHFIGDFTGVCHTFLDQVLHLCFLDYLSSPLVTNHTKNKTFNITDSQKLDNLWLGYQYYQMGTCSHRCLQAKELIVRLF